MPRRIEAWLLVNALTGEMKLRRRVGNVNALEVGYPLVVTLPEAYPTFGPRIDITMPRLPAATVEALDDLAVAGESDDAPHP